MNKYLAQISLVLLIFLIINNSNILAKSNPSSVNFFSVGNSECILIKGSKENLLIDLGEKKYANNIIEGLKKENVKEIDAIILTSFSEKRQGALEDVIKNFSVRKIFLPHDYSDESQKIFLLKKLEQLNIPYDFIKKNWSYNKGNIYLEAKLPVEKNNGSLVFLGVIDNLKYFFASDFLFNTKDYSNILGNVRGIDILKISNFGNGNLINKELVKYLDPKTTIINCDNLEQWKQVKHLIIKYGGKVNNIVDDGNIKIERDLGGKKINIITEKSGVTGTVNNNNKYNCNMY